MNEVKEEGDSLRADAPLPPYAELAYADALLHLPRRHEDRSQLTPLGRVAVGPEPRTCAGTVAGVSPPPRGRPQIPLFVTLRDASG